MGRNKKCVKKKFCLQIWMVWYTLFYLTFTWFLFSNDWYLKYFWFTSIYWITIIAFVCFFGTDNLSRINGNILWISSCFLYLIGESDRKLFVCVDYSEKLRNILFYRLSYTLRIMAALLPIRETTFFVAVVCKRWTNANKKSFRETRQKILSYFLIFLAWSKDKMAQYLSVGMFKFGVNFVTRWRAIKNIWKFVEMLSLEK